MILQYLTSVASEMSRDRLGAQRGIFADGNRGREQAITAACSSALACRKRAVPRDGDGSAARCESHGMVDSSGESRPARSRREQRSHALSPYPCVGLAWHRLAGSSRQSGKATQAMSIIAATKAQGCHASYGSLPESESVDAMPQSSRGDLQPLGARARGREQRSEQARRAHADSR